MFNKYTVNINGDLLSGDEAKISVFDRGFLFGDSIYEVTYSEDGVVIFLDEHLDRLENSSKLIDLHYNYNREFLISEMLKTLKKSGFTRAYIRLILTRGESLVNLDPTDQLKNNLVIIVKELNEYPPQMYKKGLYLTVSSVERNSIKSTDPRAKSGNYLNNVMALNEAKKKQADDAIMINANEEVTEGTSFNIWMVKDGVIYTPHIRSGILKGITRDKLIDLCRKNKLPLKVKDLSIDDFLNADEVFISSSTKGIVPVQRLDDKHYGKDASQWPVCANLMNIYKELVSAYKLRKEFYYL